MRGWVYLAVAYAVGVALVAGVIAFHQPPVLAHRITRAAPANYRLAEGDITSANKISRVFGFDQRLDHAYVGRYLKKAAASEAALAYDDTAAGPALESPEKMFIFWIPASAVAAPDQDALDPGRAIDICANLTKLTCVDDLEVVATVCTRASPPVCSVGLSAPRTKRDSVVPLLDVVAAHPLHAFVHYPAPEK